MNYKCEHFDIPIVVDFVLFKKKKHLLVRCHFMVLGSVLEVVGGSCSLVVAALPNYNQH